MRIACHTACGSESPRERKRGRNTTKSTPSAMREVPITARSRVPTRPRPPDLVSAAASIRWVSPRWRDTAKPSTDARVMTPRPPTAMASAMTPWPKIDQWVAVSTVVSPVTHTAETAVKKTSTKATGSSSAAAKGRLSRAVTMTMMMLKTARASRAGELRACRSTHSRSFSERVLRSSVDARPSTGRTSSEPGSGASGSKASTGAWGRRPREPRRRDAMRLTCLGPVSGSVARGAAGCAHARRWDARFPARGRASAVDTCRRGTPRPYHVLRGPSSAGLGSGRLMSRGDVDGPEVRPPVS